MDRPADFEVTQYFIYRRPFLSEFLHHVAERFELAVWTSSSPGHASEVCRAIFNEACRPSFIWASDRCTQMRDFEQDCWFGAKRLQKIKRRGYDLNKVLVVDDSPEKHTRNYGNLIRVEPDLGSLEDQELQYLASYLDSLTSVPHVRAIEKRNWRKK